VSGSSTPGTSNRKRSAANSGVVNWRLDKAVAAGRVKPSVSWKVGNVGDEQNDDKCQLTTIQFVKHTQNDVQSDVMRDAK